MEHLDMNRILNRDELALRMKHYVEMFFNPTKPKLQKRGLYLFGKSGIGKTSFVQRNLLEWGYDIIKYDASESRNKCIIDTISNANLSAVNILSAMNKKQKQIVLVMDEIDGMNNGDRGGITSLIKLIRTKKNKKQSAEPSINIPVICIGDCHTDKKINELKKVCEIIELIPPTQQQMQILTKLIIPNANPIFFDYIDCDLRKLDLLYNLHLKEQKQLRRDTCDQSLKTFLCNDFHYEWNLSSNTEMDVKSTTLSVLTTNPSFFEHDKIINDNDRTIVGLLYHENVVDIIEKLKATTPLSILLRTYSEVLSNFCFSDYIDRVIFQKQIWQLNEMSSLVKTFYNTFILQEISCKTKKAPIINSIRFTKILTKYSSEYNNSSFIIDMTQSLMIDKSDVFSFFLYIKEKLGDNQNDILQWLVSEFDVSHLDTLRLYRYMDKYINSAVRDDDSVTIES